METLLTGATSRVDTTPVHLSPKQRGAIPPRLVREPTDGQDALHNTRTPKNLLATARVVWVEGLSRWAARELHGFSQAGMNSNDRRREPSGRN
jgi:hypothetical protein